MNLNFIKKIIAVKITEGVSESSERKRLKVSRNFLVAHIAFYVVAYPVPEATDPGESRAAFAQPSSKGTINHSLVVREESDN